MLGVQKHDADVDCVLQSNFKKYASGEGFVSAELAHRIVQAGPVAVYSNGTNGVAHHESSSSGRSSEEF